LKTNSSRLSRRPGSPTRRALRIGIYAGAFNPVHTGHIAFALQALQEANLDRLYFLPERQPRNKPGAEHFGHRVAMLRQAARPYRRFGVLELTDVNFTPERTLPKLERQFGGNQLVFLLGSDVVTGVPAWPKVQRLLKECELVVGLRIPTSREEIVRQIAAWPTPPRAAHIFTSYAADISSGSVRAGLQRRVPVRGLLASVRQYSSRHWLYVSLTQ
jgi:nicotinate-nucleotide adenylyltransferase